MLELIYLLIVFLVYGFITFKFIGTDISTIHKYHGNLIFSVITVVFFVIQIYLIGSGLYLW